MKKIFFSALTMSAIITPLVGVVSCAGNNEVPVIIDTKKTILGSHVVASSQTNNAGVLTLFAQEEPEDIQIKIEKLFTDQPSFNKSQSLTWVTPFDPTKTGLYILNLNDKNGDLVYELVIKILDLPQVSEDGFYLLSDFYQGQILNNEKPNSDSNMTMQAIGINNGWNYTDAVMLGDDDALFLIYDKDNADGFNINNFTESVYFLDTSIMTSPAINDINQNDLNNYLEIVDGYYSTYVGFNDQGNLNQYVGSQIFGIEQDFQKSLKAAYDFYQKQNQLDFANAILQYYGYVLRSDGTFAKDLPNGAAPSQPAFQKESILTAEKVATNIMKITYHGSSTWMQMQAKMVLKNPTTNEINKYGSLVLGTETVWSKYRSNESATYDGFKVKE